MDEKNYEKDNYSIKLKKEFEKDSILINCENKDNKKIYFKEFTADNIINLFGKPLDETFHLLCEWFNGNNYFIEERNDEINIKINDTNKDILIPLNLKPNNSIVSNSSVEINELSSIKDNSGSRKIDDTTNNILIIIPTNENLNSSVINDYRELFNIFQPNYKEIKLTDLSKLCLVKKISSDLLADKNVHDLLKQEFIKILFEIDKNIHLTGDLNQDLETMIKEKKVFNILSYSNNLKNSILNMDIIKLLFNLKDEKRAENEKYWNYLSLFQEHNEHFETTFIKDLKNCYFDYSLVSINCVLSENLEEYQKRNFEYKKKIILYHNSEIKPSSKIFKDMLKISIIPQDENNFYDNFEYFAFNPKNKNKKEKRKIIQTNSTFSFSVSEVFFQEESISNISKYIIQSSQNSENTILNKSEIHSVSFEGEDLKQEHKSLGYCYTIKEKSQILPLYTLTLKRNEYFVLHRDPNFNEKNGHAQFLKNIQNKNQDIFDINIYYESSTEEALEFLLKRKYNKVILITNVGKNLEGKRFVDIVRKIYGFEVLVLFFSHNKKHLEWIKDYKNSLFTDNIDYYREYITNFNEKELKNLKEKLEKELSIQFIFTHDFIAFSRYLEKGNFSSLNFKCEYFRQGYFKNGKNYLYMSKEGNVYIKPEKCKWTITLLNNEITLLSNEFYLDIIEDTEKVKGSKQMVILGFNIRGREYFNFFSKSKDNNNASILSIEKGEIKVNKISPGKIYGENETFIFDEDLEDDLKEQSYLEEKIESVVDSLSYNSNLNMTS